jgi:ABC-2 type transport system permease protein
LWIGSIALLLLNLLFWAICYRLLKSGWKIKN